LHEIEKISPLEENRMPYRVTAKLAEEQLNFQNRDYSSQALESLYRFFLGSIAGGILLKICFFFIHTKKIILNNIKSYRSVCSVSN